MEIKTSDNYQKEVLEKYKSEGGGEMSTYLTNPTRKNIRAACLWLLDRRKEKNDEYILNRFFQFKKGEDKETHIRGLKSEKADKFIPVVNFLKGKTHDTSDENIELISWLIDFKPRPLQEYLRTHNSVSQNKKGNTNNGKDGFVNQDIGNTEEFSEEEVGPTKGIKWLTISISIAFGVIVIFISQKWSANQEFNNPSEYMCMTWADSLYVKVSCKRGPFSQYGTKIEPLIETKLKNMRKVSVDAAYQFFTEDGKPLIWYFKNEENKHEFFTSPGLHPITGETLRKITPYIIQTYVPLHQYKKESFVQ